MNIEAPGSSAFQPGGLDSVHRDHLRTAADHVFLGGEGGISGVGDGANRFEPGSKPLTSAETPVPSGKALPNSGPRPGSWVAVVMGLVFFLTGCGPQSSAGPTGTATAPPPGVEVENWRAVSWPEPIEAPHLKADSSQLPDGSMGSVAGGHFRHGGWPGRHRGPLAEPVGTADGKKVLGVSLQAKNLVGVFDVTTGMELTQLDAHVKPIRVLAASPAGNHWASGDDAGEIVLWSGDGEFVATLSGNTAPISALRFSADGQWLVAGAQDGAVGVWDLDSGKEVTLVNIMSRSITEVAIASDGSMFAARTHGAFRLYTTASGEELEVSGQPDHMAPRLRRMAFVPTAVGEELFLGCQAQLLVVNLEELEIVASAQLYERNKDELGARAESAADWLLESRDRILVLRESGAVDVVSLNGEVESLSDGWPSARLSLARLGTEKLLLSSPLRWGVVQPDGDIAPSPVGHLTPIIAASWSADGRVLFLMDEDGILGMWDREDSSPIQIKELAIGTPRGLAVDPANRYLAALGSDALVVIDLPDGEPRVLLEQIPWEPEEPQPWHRLSFSTDGEVLAISRRLADYHTYDVQHVDPASGDTLLTWTWREGEPGPDDVELVSPIVGYEGYDSGYSVETRSADGRMVATAWDWDDDRKLSIKDTARGYSIQDYPLTTMPAELHYSPDGEVIAGLMPNGEVLFWQSPVAPPIPEIGQACVECVGSPGSAGTCAGQEDNCWSGCLNSESCQEPRDLLRACIADSGCPRGDEACVITACQPACVEVLGEDVCELRDGLFHVYRHRLPGDSALVEQAEGKTAAHGYPLPVGATARLGEMRWRAGQDLLGLEVIGEEDLLLGFDEDGFVFVFDLDSGEPLRTLELGGQHVSPDEFAVTSGGLLARAHSFSPRSVRLWDLNTGTLREEILLPRPSRNDFSTVSVAAGRGHLAWSNGSIVTVRDLESGEEWQVDVGEFSPNLIALDGDGKHLATAGGGGTLRLWDVSSGQKLGETSFQDEFPDRLEFSDDGALLMVQDYSDTYVYQVPSMEPDESLTLRRKERLIFTPDGGAMIAKEDGGLTLISRDGSQLLEMDAGDMKITGATLHGGTIYLSAGTIIRRIESENGKELPRSQGLGTVPKRGLEVANGAVAVCSGQEMATWKDGELVHHVVLDKDDQIQSCGLSPDGQQQIAGVAADVDMGGYYSSRPTYSPQVFVYELGSAQPTMLSAGELVLDVSSDGNSVRAFVGWDRVAAFEIPGQERLASAESTTGALAPGGRFGVSMPEKSGAYGMAYAEGLTIVDFESGRRRSIELDGDILTQAFGFSPNGEWLATPSDGKVRIVELATGESIDVELPTLRVFDRDESPYRSLAVAASNDGQYVAVAWGRRVFVFHSSGEQVASWWTGDSKVRGISFDEGGDVYTLLDSGVVLQFEGPGR